MWTAWISFVAAVWLFISGLIPAVHVPANLSIPGAIIMILGFYSWPNVPGLFNGIIGFWLVVSGFGLDIMHTWNFMIFGGFAALFAAWNAKGSQTDLHPRTTMHHAALK